VQSATLTISENQDAAPSVNKLSLTHEGTPEVLCPDTDLPA